MKLSQIMKAARRDRNGMKRKRVKMPRALPRNFGVASASPRTYAIVVMTAKRCIALM